MSQCSRNHIDEDRKKDKQLLTPNIKRFLKTWLLDHKDYPYPDRYEKILLAQETGLTIMQVMKNVRTSKYEISQVHIFFFLGNVDFKCKLTYISTEFIFIFNDTNEYPLHQDVYLLQ